MENADLSHIKKLLFSRRSGAWITGVTFILALSFFRVATDAEYTVASIVIIPIAAVSWEGRLSDGLILSVLAALMWITTDLVSGRNFSSDWIPFTNSITRLATYSLIAFMTAKVRTLLDKETERATQDELTGLLNRRAFFEAGSAEVSRSRRYGEAVTVIFLDLDDFKLLNDTCGHETGDNALKAVALSLRQTLRESDRVARLGGDEFAILLPEIGADAAEEASRKVAAAVTRALVPYPPVSASIGVAWFERAQDEFSTLINVADNLMYEIKRSGKGSLLVKRFLLG